MWAGGHGQGDVQSQAVLPTWVLGTAQRGTRFSRVPAAKPLHLGILAAICTQGPNPRRWQGDAHWPHSMGPRCQGSCPWLCQPSPPLTACVPHPVVPPGHGWGLSGWPSLKHPWWVWECGGGHGGGTAMAWWGCHGGHGDGHGRT